MLVIARSQAGEEKGGEGWASVTKSQRCGLPPGCIPTLSVAGNVGSATYATK